MNDNCLLLALSYNQRFRPCVFAWAQAVTTIQTKIRTLYIAVAPGM